MWIGRKKYVVEKMFLIKAYAEISDIYIEKISFIALINSLLLWKSHDSTLPFDYLIHLYKFYVGVNSFWMIQNNKPVIDYLIKLVIFVSVSIYDFSALYTNIPQDKLIKTLTSVYGNCM